jgi:tetratricopeptide (TPR) repeat protein
MKLPARPPIAHLRTGALRLFYNLARLLVPVVLLAHVALAALSPDPRDSLRAADTLFMNGHYYAAHQRYTALADHPAAARIEADVLLRLGMVHALRGEYVPAEKHLLSARRRPLPPPLHDIAALYLGYVLRQQGLTLRSDHAWQALAPTFQYRGVKDMLLAEWHLHHRRYRAARTAYTSAQRAPLPARWYALATYRLALLEAAHQPDQARSRLETLTAPPTRAATSAPPHPFLTPLLPDVRDDAADLLATLHSDPDQRAMLLGQWYLGQGYYDLAEAQFMQQPGDDPPDLETATYLAYTHWQAGHPRESQQQLETLLEEHPDAPQVRILLALIYLSQNNLEAARTHIATLTERYPRLADVYLSWAHWYIAQQNYLYAVEGYKEALSLAPTDERGKYALLQARFHLDTGFRLCEEGYPVAEIAVQELPDNPDAWTTAAATRYHCLDFERAVAAAHHALELGGGASATYYLGITLSAMGDYPGARAAFIETMDRAPASVWRKRAEEKLSLVQ